MSSDTMPAGREMDRAVAIECMGWIQVETGINPEQKIYAPPTGNPHDDGFWLGKMVDHLVPKFSTDIAAAWKVVEKLKTIGIHLWWVGEEDSTPGWTASMGINLKPGVTAWAESAPLALCRAARKAMGA